MWEKNGGVARSLRFRESCWTGLRGDHFGARRRARPGIPRGRGREGRLLREDVHPPPAQQRAQQDEGLVEALRQHDEREGRVRGGAVDEVDERRHVDRGEPLGRRARPFEVNLLGRAARPELPGDAVEDVDVLLEARPLDGDASAEPLVQPPAPTERWDRAVSPVPSAGERPSKYSSGVASLWNMATADATRDATSRETVTHRAAGRYSARASRSSVAWSSAMSYAGVPAGRARAPWGASKRFALTQRCDRPVVSSRMWPWFLLRSMAMRSLRAKRRKTKRVLDPAVLIVLRKKSFSFGSWPNRVWLPHGPRLVAKVSATSRRSCARRRCKIAIDPSKCRHRRPWSSGCVSLDEGPRTEAETETAGCRSVFRNPIDSHPSNDVQH